MAIKPDSKTYRDENLQAIVLKDMKIVSIGPGMVQGGFTKRSFIEFETKSGEFIRLEGFFGDVWIHQDFVDFDAGHTGNFYFSADGDKGIAGHFRLIASEIDGRKRVNVLHPKKASPFLDLLFFPITAFSAWLDSKFKNKELSRLREFAGFTEENCLVYNK